MCDLISEAQAARDNLSESLKTGNKLLEEWGVGEPTLSTIDRVISVVKDTKKMDNIKTTFNETSSYEIEVDLSNFRNGVKKITQEIASTEGATFSKVKFMKGKIVLRGLGPFFALLEWEEQENTNEFIVSVKKEENWKQVQVKTFKWNGFQTRIMQLDPVTRYTFTVQPANSGGNNGSLSLKVKTPLLTVESLLESLDSKLGDAYVYMEALNKLNWLIKSCTPFHHFNKTQFHFYSIFIQLIGRLKENKQR